MGKGLEIGDLFFLTVCMHAGECILIRRPNTWVGAGNVQSYLSFKYRIAQKFRGSKFSRIAVFENFVEIISRIHCPKHATPTLIVYGRDGTHRAQEVY